MFRFFGEALRQAGILVLGSALVIWGMVFILGLECGIEGAYFTRAQGAPAFAGVFSAWCDLREMVPYMFGYIMSAKVGTGIVAELGAMRINEEIDALEVIGVRPITFLTATRLLAAWMVLPFIYLSAVGVGFLASYLAVVVGGNPHAPSSRPRGRPARKRRFSYVVGTSIRPWSGPSQSISRSPTSSAGDPGHRLARRHAASEGEREQALAGLRLAGEQAERAAGAKPLDQPGETGGGRRRRIAWTSRKRTLFPGARARRGRIERRDPGPSLYCPKDTARRHAGGQLGSGALETSRRRIQVREYRGAPHTSQCRRFRVLVLPRTS